MTSVYLHHSTLPSVTIIFAIAATGFSFHTQSNLCSDTLSSNVYIGNVEDCSMYYFCHNNNEYAVKCPVGLYFNKETARCDFSENVNCNIINTTDSPGLEGVSIISPAPGFDCPGDGKWPHETACEKFYECTGGEANLGICTERMLFDLRYNECNFPEGVDCGDRNRPTDIPGTMTPPVSTTTITSSTTTTRTTTAGTTFPSSETPETEDPTTNTVEPSTNTIEPSTNTVEPSTNTVEPSTNTVEPSTNTVEPSTNTIEPSTTRPTSTSVPTTPESVFVCPRPEGNFADPEDCTAFYSCFENEVIGHQYCPDGLLFNPILENCDYPWNVECNVD